MIRCTDLLYKELYRCLGKEEAGLKFSFSPPVDFLTKEQCVGEGVGGNYVRLLTQRWPKHIPFLNSVNDRN